MLVKIFKFLDVFEVFRNVCMHGLLKMMLLPLITHVCACVRVYVFVWESVCLWVRICVSVLAYPCESV